MEYFKDKDTALKEIQTSDTKSSLGIPPREIRGTLNQIPQNKSYGIGNRSSMSPSEKILSSSVGEIKRSVDETISRTLPRAKSLLEEYRKENYFQQDLEQDTLVQQPITTFESDESAKTQALNDLFKDYRAPAPQPLPELQITEKEEEDLDWFDFKRGFQKAWNYVKSTYYGAIGDTDAVEDIYKIEEKARKKVTSGDQFAQEFLSAFGEDETIGSTTKKIISSIVNNPKGLVNLMSQELPQLAVPFAIGLPGLLVRGGMLVKGLVGYSTYTSGNAAIELGARHLTYAEDGLTKEELKKSTNEGLKKSAVLGGVDLISGGVAAKFLTGSIGKEVDNVTTAILKREGINSNNLQKDLQTNVAETLKSSAEKQLSKNEINQALSKTVSETLENAGVTDDIVSKVSKGVDKRVSEINKFITKRPKDMAKLVAAFGLQVGSEGVGEYAGSAVIGEADIAEASLESLVASVPAFAELMILGYAKRKGGGNNSFLGQSISNQDKLKQIEKLEADIDAVEKAEKEIKEKVEEETGKKTVQETDQEVEGEAPPEVLIDEILKLDATPSFLAAHINNFTLNKDEQSVDILNKIIEDFDNKNPNNKLSSKVDLILQNEDELSKATAKTILMESAINKGVIEDDEIKIETINRENVMLGGFGISEFMLYGKNKFAERTAPSFKDNIKTEKDATVDPKIETEKKPKKEASVDEINQQLDEAAQDDFKEDVIFRSARNKYTVVDDLEKEKKISELPEFSRKVSIALPKENESDINLVISEPSQKFESTAGKKLTKTKASTRPSKIEKQLTQSNENLQQFISNVKTANNLKDDVELDVKLAAITTKQKEIQEQFKKIFNTDVLFVTDSNFTFEESQRLKRELILKNNKSIQKLLANRKIKYLKENYKNIPAKHYRLLSKANLPEAKTILDKETYDAYEKIVKKDRRIKQLNRLFAETTLDSQSKDMALQLLNQDKDPSSRFKQSDGIRVLDKSKSKIDPDTGEVIFEETGKVVNSRGMHFISNKTKNNTIVINVDEVSSTKLLNQVLAHELTHAIETNKKILNSINIDKLFDNFYKTKPKLLKELESRYPNDLDRLRSEKLAVMFQDLANNTSFWEFMFADIYENVVIKKLPRFKDTKTDQDSKVGREDSDVDPETGETIKEAANYFNEFVRIIKTIINIVRQKYNDIRKDINLQQRKEFAEQNKEQIKILEKIVSDYSNKLSKYDSKFLESEFKKLIPAENVLSNIPAVIEEIESRLTPEILNVRKQELRNKINLLSRRIEKRQKEIDLGETEKLAIPIDDLENKKIELENLSKKLEDVKSISDKERKKLENLLNLATRIHIIENKLRTAQSKLFNFKNKIFSFDNKEDKNFIMNYFIDAINKEVTQQSQTPSEIYEAAFSVFRQLAEQNIDINEVTIEADKKRSNVFSSSSDIYVNPYEYDGSDQYIVKEKELNELRKEYIDLLDQIKETKSSERKNFLRKQLNAKKEQGQKKLAELKSVAENITDRKIFQLTQNVETVFSEDESEVPNLLDISNAIESQKSTSVEDLSIQHIDMETKDQESYDNLLNSLKKSISDNGYILNAMQKIIDIAYFKNDMKKPPRLEVKGATETVDNTEIINKTISNLQQIIEEGSIPSSIQKRLITYAKEFKTNNDAVIFLQLNKIDDFVNIKPVETKSSRADFNKAFQGFDKSIKDNPITQLKRRFYESLFFKLAANDIPISSIKEAILKNSKVSPDQVLTMEFMNDFIAKQNKEISKEADVLLDRNLSEMSEEQRANYLADLVIDINPNNKNRYLNLFHGFVRNKIFTFKQIHDYIASRYTKKSYNELRKSFIEGSYLHIKYDLETHMKNAMQKNINRVVAQHEWFDSLYSAENNPFTNQETESYKSTLPEWVRNEYKLYKKNRAQTLNRKAQLDNPYLTNNSIEELFNNLLFVRYPYNTILKLEQQGFESLTEDDMKTENDPVLDDVLDGTDSYRNKLRQLEMLSNNIPNLKALYFEQVMEAISVQPSLSNRISEKVENSPAGKDFITYLENNYKNKGKKGETPSEHTVRENTRSYLLNLKVVIEDRMEQGDSYEDALNMAFDIVKLAQENQTITEIESEVINEKITDAFEKGNTANFTVIDLKKISQLHNTTMTNSAIGDLAQDVEKQKQVEDTSNADKAHTENLVNQNKLLFKLGGLKDSKVFSTLYVRSKVDLLLEKFDTKFNITVVNNTKDLPDNEFNKLTEIEKLSAKGLFNGANGEIYLFSDNLVSDADIEFTLFHELYGHFGLRSLFGKDFDSFLEQQYKINSKLRKETDKFITENNLTKDQKLLAIEEVLADEIALNNTGTFLTKVLARIISFLDTIGLRSVAAYFRNITSKEVVFELARMKAREGNIEGPIGERNDIRTSAPNEQDKIEKSDEGIPSATLKKAEELRKQLRLVHFLLYDDSVLFQYEGIHRFFGAKARDIMMSALRKKKNAAVDLVYNNKTLQKFLLQQKFITKEDLKEFKLNQRTTIIDSEIGIALQDAEIRLTNQIGKILKSGSVYRSVYTNIALPRDTKENKTTIRIDAQDEEGNKLTAYYYAPADTWFLVKNDTQFLVKYDSAKDGKTPYERVLDDIRERAGKKQYTISQRRSTPFSTFAKTREGIAEDTEKFNPRTGKKRNFFGVYFRRFYFNHVNKFTPLKELLDTLRRKGLNKELRIGTTLLDRMMLNESKIGALLEDFKVKYVRPLQNLIQDAKELGATPEIIDQFLHAQTAEERNKHIEKITPEKKKDGSGMKTEKAKEILAKYDSKNPDRPAYADQLIAIGEILDALSDNKTKMLFESGLISKKVYDGLTSTYQHYRNLSSVDIRLDEKPQILSTTGGGFSVSSSGVQRSLGRDNEKDVENIVINTLIGYEQAIIRSEQNKVSQLVLAFFEQLQDNTLTRIQQIPNPKKGLDENGYVTNIFNEEENDVEGKVFTRINGVRFEIQFQNVLPAGTTRFSKDAMSTTFLERQESYQEQVYRALVGYPPDPINPLAKLIRTFTKNLGGLVTTYNPLFITTNALRDVGTAFLTMGSDPKVGYSKAFKMIRNYNSGVRAALLYLYQREKGSRKLSSKVTRGFVKGVGVATNIASGIGSIFNGKVPSFRAEPELVKVIEESLRDFKGEGGMTFYLDRLNAENQRKEIFKELGIDPKTKVDKVKDSLKGFGSIIENMSVIFEIAPRFAAYQTMRETGSSATEAALYAKELTSNFNLRGVNSSLSSYYIFFNPAMQGTRRILENVVRDGINGRTLSPAFFKLAFNLAAIGFFANMIARALSCEDDEKMCEYDKLNNWVKATNLVFFPGQLGGAIPLPYGYNALVAFGTQLADTFLDGKHPVDAMQEWMQTLIESMIPFAIGLEGDIPFYQKTLKVVSPTAFLPGVELLVNENRFGSPITRNPNNVIAEKSDAYSGFDSVHPVLTSAMQFLNDNTGGHEYKDGKISINPATIEHLVTSYLPGLPANLFRYQSRQTRIGLGYDLENRGLIETLLVSRFKRKAPEGWHYGAYQRLFSFVESDLQVATKVLPQEILQRYANGVQEYKRTGNMPIEISNLALGTVMKKAVDQGLKELRAAKNKLKSIKSKAEEIKVNNRIRDIEKQLYYKLFDQALQLDKQFNRNTYRDVILGRD